MPHRQLNTFGQFRCAILKNESMLEQWIGRIALHGRPLETRIAQLGSRQQGDFNIRIDRTTIRSAEFFTTQNCREIKADED